MKIIFFTEAGTNIGYGHITRCYSLFQAFQKLGFSPQFVVNTDVDISPIVADAEPVFLNWLQNTKECLSYLTENQIVIFDSYLAAPEYLLQLAGKVKTPVFIDDFIRMNYPFGIVFNGAVGAEELPYPRNKEVKYLLGLQYQPIRSAFWNLPKHAIVNPVTKVFITVGGNDIHNILPRIVSHTKKQFPDAVYDIVCGNNPGMKAWVEDLNNPKIRAHFNLSAPEMSQLMQVCDFAISAAGQTLYELAASGLPTIAFSVANNQATNLKGWTNAGFVLNSGFCTEPGFFTLLDHNLKIISDPQIRKNSSITGQKLVNEHGGINTTREIIKYHLQNNLEFVPAKETDIDHVYNLSNDVEVRLNSFNTSRIEYNEHVTWFLKKINDPASLFLIAKTDGNFAGQVRYQIDDKNAVIGISIANSHRGYGLGETMLVKTAEILRLKFPHVKKIIAHVKTENIASGKMFLKAGYSEVPHPEHKLFEFHF